VPGRAVVDEAVRRRARGLAALGDRARLARLDPLGALAILLGRDERLQRHPQLAEHRAQVERPPLGVAIVIPSALERAEDPRALLDAFGAREAVDVDHDQDVEGAALGVAPRAAGRSPSRFSSWPVFAERPSSTYVPASVQPCDVTNAGSTRSWFSIVWRSRCGTCAA
jgi:hypothetical protein